MNSVHAPGAAQDTFAHDHTIPVFARWIGSWQVSLRRSSFTRSELVQSYDRAAVRWHRTIGRLDVPGAYGALLTRVLPALPEAGTGAELRALDCGVGTGALSLALARLIGRSLRLDALDISPRMLAEARRRLDAAGVAATLREAAVEKLPYRDGSFDLVMAAHLLEHLPDPGRALAEMVRVTRPGGLVVACLTRRGALGLYVHMRWRTHMVTSTDAEAWLRRSGLRHVRCVGCGRGGIVPRLSLACVGIKPAGGGSSLRAVRRRSRPRSAAARGW